MAGAYEIAEALGGRPSGEGWTCLCPSHDDARPSLAVAERDGKLLIYCRAGCAQSAVIAALQKLGLWGRAVRGAVEVKHVHEPVKPLRDPLTPWRDALLAFPGSLVRVYLGGRGIVLTDAEAEALRFAPACWHWPTKSIWPAMTALVRLADGTGITCHETFLARDGSGKAPIDRSRLFPKGVSPAGAAVWFGQPNPSDEFVVAEGIESLLSALRLCGVLAGCAALSTTGIRKLILPSEARRVRVFADHDKEGHGLNAARASYHRWRAEGREVHVTLPERVGDDANDILMRRLRHE